MYSCLLNPVDMAEVCADTLLQSTHHVLYYDVYSEGKHMFASEGRDNLTCPSISREHIGYAGCLAFFLPLSLPLHPLPAD